jgi:hypothetical protein
MLIIAIYSSGVKWHESILIAEQQKLIYFLPFRNIKIKESLPN